jgi:hypothetical protein
MANPNDNRPTFRPYLAYLERYGDRNVLKVNCHQRLTTMPTGKSAGKTRKRRMLVDDILDAVASTRNSLRVAPFRNEADGKFLVTMLIELDPAVYKKLCDEAAKTRTLACEVSAALYRGRVQRLPERRYGTSGLSPGGGAIFFARAYAIWTFQAKYHGRETYMGSNVRRPN